MKRENRVACRSFSLTYHILSQVHLNTPPQEIHGYINESIVRPLTSLNVLMDHRVNCIRKQAYDAQDYLAYVTAESQAFLDKVEARMDESNLELYKQMDEYYEKWSKEIKFLSESKGKIGLLKARLHERQPTQVAKPHFKNTLQKSIKQLGSLEYMEGGGIPHGTHQLIHSLIL